jgi:polyribonucleotide nucleotidyltransferase
MPDAFAYTTRIVSDILESNGSSSMATVCAGSLALMDAGVPVKSAISGIAMGLVSENGKTSILSDILGDEDALGDMDFKVTGTRNGICGAQMDMKIDGLSYELLEQALEQARKGRLHILEEMDKSISIPNPDLKPHAPRIIEIIIEKSFIGAVIGPGGKIIQEMQAKTGTKINIEEVGDKGVINIAGTNKEGMEAALAMVQNITFVPQIGDVFDGKVSSIFPFGVFVDFKNKSGLLHVSEISHSRIDNVEDVFKVGDAVKIKLIGLDPKTGKLRLSRKALMPRNNPQSQKNEIEG